jgi:hypothetical protein
LRKWRLCQHRPEFCDISFGIAWARNKESGSELEKVDWDSVFLSLREG